MAMPLVAASDHISYLEGYIKALEWVLRERPDRKQIMRELDRVKAELESFEQYIDDWF